MQHTHTGMVAFLFAGMSALVFINVWRIGATMLATNRNGTVATVGTAMGALTHFGN